MQDLHSTYLTQERFRSCRSYAPPTPQREIDHTDQDVPTLNDLQVHHRVGNLGYVRRVKPLMFEAETQKMLRERTVSGRHKVFRGAHHFFDTINMVEGSCVRYE